ncbi:MAG: 50S ribosomal protein L17 [Anaerolinea sp.]|nr:50S ribosomal protein L17 [Anaerolinea sp.]
MSGYRLSRDTGHRTQLRRTLIKQLFEHEKITTTRAKASAIRGEAEKLITLAKNSSSLSDIEKVNARRLASSYLGNANDTVKKLFDDLGPRYSKRPGGYTRMLKLGPRLGDAAEMVLLELVEE